MLIRGGRWLFIESFPLFPNRDYSRWLLIQDLVYPLRPSHHAFCGSTIDRIRQGCSCRNASRTPRLSRCPTWPAWNGAQSRVFLLRSRLSQSQCSHHSEVQAIYKPHLTEMTSRVPAGPPVLSLRYTPGRVRLASTAYTSPCSSSCGWA